MLEARAHTLDHFAINGPARRTYDLANYAAHI
jgi:hypothetical protein